MDGLTCHLCGEAMEPDVVLAQGDTCDLCFLSAVPVEGVAVLHDVDHHAVVIASETVDVFDALFG